MAFVIRTNTADKQKHLLQGCQGTGSLPVVGAKLKYYGKYKICCWKQVCINMAL